jgi:hypothetical protein
MTAPATPIQRLYAVADDSEIEALDDLAIRAGLLWRCPQCQNLNPETVSPCEDCGVAA